MVKVALKSVLVADPLDAAAVETLKKHNVVVDVKTGLSESQLVNIIPVSNPSTQNVSRL